MFLFEGLGLSLQKQDLADYLYKKINEMKTEPHIQLKSVLVQVVGESIVSDGLTNFQCVFKDVPAAKGCYLRLTDWKIDTKDYRLIIDGYQYLGGKGYNVRSGRAWDTEKLKCLNNSKLTSLDYIILHTPNNQIQTINLPLPALETLKDANTVRQKAQDRQLEAGIFRSSYINNQLPADTPRAEAKASKIKETNNINPEETFLKYKMQEVKQLLGNSKI